MLRSIKTQFILILLFLLFNSSTSIANNFLVLKGVLGKHPVVMQIEKTKNSFKANSYFYMEKGVDIPLSGDPKLIAEAIPLDDKMQPSDESNDEATFIDPQTKVARITWQGKFADKTYQGIWKNAKNGKTLSFNLKQVASYKDSQDKDNNEISMDKNPYDYLRMQYPFTLGKEIFHGKVAYRMFTDTRSGFSFPLLTRHPNHKIMAKINSLLKQDFWSLDISSLSEDANIYLTPNSSCDSCGSTFDIKVNYLSQSLMSIGIYSSSYETGAAHPLNGYETMSFDLIHGKSLNFNDLFYTWKFKEEDHERKRILSPELIRFLATNIEKEQSKNIGPEDDYNIDCLAMLQDDNFYFDLEFESPNKLVFSIVGVPYYLASACLGPQLKVPFSELSPILKPGAKLYLRH